MLCGALSVCTGVRGIPSSRAGRAPVAACVPCVGAGTQFARRVWLRLLGLLLSLSATLWWRAQVCLSPLCLKGCVRRLRAAYGGRAGGQVALPPARAGRLPSQGEAEGGEGAAGRGAPEVGVGGRQEDAPDLSRARTPCQAARGGGGAVHGGGRGSREPQGRRPVGEGPDEHARGADRGRGRGAGRGSAPTTRSRTCASALHM